jgi:Mannosyl-glycoprotein endo-beta-N-acetylglucosaminidase
MNEKVTRDSVVMAAPRAAQEKAAAYINQRKVSMQYSVYDISSVIVPAYYEEARKVGIDPVIALAQVIHETGFLSSWWCARPRRNPAGIGVTGEMKKSLTRAEAESEAWAYDPDVHLWKKGLSFGNWTDESIPAHIARMLGYAVKKENMTADQLAYYTEHTIRRPLPPRVIGCAPTLAGFEGTWAVPGKGYADRLAAFATAIINTPVQTEAV